MFKVNRKNLIHALAHLKKTATCRALPILSDTVFLSVQAGKLRLRSTDLETSVVFTLRLEEGATPFQGIFAIKPMLDALRSAKHPSITLDLSSDDAYSGRLVFDGAVEILSTFDPGDYPVEADDDPVWKHKVPLKEFCDTVKEISYAINPEERRYNINNLRLDGEEGMLVGCDGHRLVASSIVHWGLPEGQSLNIPIAGITHAANIFGGKKTDANVKIGLRAFQNKDNKAFRLRVGYSDVYVDVRLGEQEYADWTKPLPAISGARIKFSRTEALNALSVAGIFCKDKKQETNRVLYVMIENDGIRFLSTARDDPNQKAQATVPCDYRGKLIDTKVNKFYLEEALKHIPEEGIEMVVGRFGEAHCFFFLYGDSVGAEDWRKARSFHWLAGWKLS